MSDSKNNRTEIDVDSKNNNELEEEFDEDLEDTEDDEEDDLNADDD